jgi:hypothetical protein
MPDSRTLQELTVNELTSIISRTVKQAIEDELEDLRALASSNYLLSVKEARRDYVEGNEKPLDDLFPEDA